MRTGGKWVAGLLAMGLASCAGNDPFSVIQDNADAFPPLESPISTNFLTANSGFGIGGSDGFDYSNFGTVGSTPLQIAAPGPGIVTQVDGATDAPFFAVFIRHSPRLSTRISKIPVATVRAGEYVTAGAAIGTLTNAFTSTIRMSVFVDGVATCPLSYLSSAARVAFQSVGNFYPCRQ